MYNNKYYEKYMNIDNEFKNRINTNYELILNKLKKKAETHETLFTVLPYNMNGSTVYKKLAEKYIKS